MFKPFNHFAELVLSKVEGFKPLKDKSVPNVPMIPAVPADKPSGGRTAA
jgi:hypothetical protein